MELTVYKTSGEETAKKVVLEDTVFGVEPNDHAIYLDVKQYLANARQGTHKSKQRNEVAGSTPQAEAPEGYGRCPLRFDQVASVSRRRSYLRSGSPRL